MRVHLKAATAIALLFAGSSPAYAYLDPATGTIIVQAIIGSIAAGAAVIGVYWQSARSYVSRAFRRTEAPDGEGDDRSR